MFHPAACLIVWLIFAVAIQFYGCWALLLVAALLGLFARAAHGRWFGLVRRAKWLLLSLWLILAYGLPGDLWLGYGWAPSLEGIDAASLQAMRLIVLLGSIAWLFEALPQRQFIAGLWVLLQSVRYLGGNADRSVARLALVFDYLEHAPPRGTWRHFLDQPEEPEHSSASMQLEIPRWHGRDSLFLLAALVLPAFVLVP